MSRCWNIPSTLRGMMMARMDRLSEQDRDVLQKAAVIGRSFTYRLLALLTGLDDVLDESLARLKDAEFIVGASAGGRTGIWLQARHRAGDCL